MKDKSVSCSTVRDLMAMEGEGLLSAESQELVGEHLKHCIHCRRARQDMGLKVDFREAGKVNVSNSYPPIPLIQRAMNWLKKLKLFIAVLVLLAILGLYRHNYLQPLVVEERNYYDRTNNQFVITGKWRDIRDQPFSVKGYNFTCSVEDLVRASNFKVILGHESEQALTGEEAMEWLENWKEPIAINVAVHKYRAALLARTGWLVWHRSDYDFAEVGLAFMPWGEREGIGFGSSTVQIHEHRDADYGVPLVLAEGKERHSTLLPVRISRPGRWWRP